MKKVFCGIVLLAATFACAQGNGPTVHSVTLNWTQGAPSTGGTLTQNCIYRGTAAGVYAPAAIFCSAIPVTTYADLTVTGGTNFHYAVTLVETVSGVTKPVESAYSNDALAAVPGSPTPPTLGPSVTASVTLPAVNLEAKTRIGAFDLVATVNY
jgi:hypothetical protein